MVGSSIADEQNPLKDVVCGGVAVSTEGGGLFWMGGRMVSTVVGLHG